MSKQIEVWYDETSDDETTDKPVWCVSLTDGSGNDFKCLGTYDEKDDAIGAGWAVAQQRGLPLRLCERKPLAS